jgi:hypothetical protein
MSGKRRDVGKVVGKSATSPLNLSVIGAAALGAVALSMWPLAALGGAAYAALVVSDVSNPEFRRRALGRSGAALPNPKHLKDPELRELVGKLAAARKDIDTTVSETPQRVRRNLTTTLRSLEELQGHAAILILRANDLGIYLDRVDLTQAREEATELNRRADGARDHGTAKEYELAAKAAAERLAALDDIESGRQRIFADLARILATLRGVPPKIVRMRALDDRASDSLTGDFDRELDRMNTDLRAFEQTLEALAEVPP